MSTLRYELLPEHLRGGVQRYIEHGIQPGHFLTAVICNDLIEACGRADETCKRELFNIVKWFYNEAPVLCWKSPERMLAWMEARRDDEARE